MNSEEALQTIEFELKVLQIIKHKKVNVYHIWAFDTYEQYCEHYPFAEYHAEQDKLTEKEWILLKAGMED